MNFLLGTLFITYTIFIGVNGKNLTLFEYFFIFSKKIPLYAGLRLHCNNLRNLSHLFALRAGSRLHCNCFAVATSGEPLAFFALRAGSRLHCNCFAVATSGEPLAFFALRAGSRLHCNCFAVTTIKKGPVAWPLL